MRSLTLCPAAILCGSLFGGSAVLADVTVDDVWDHWVAASSGPGRNLTVGTSARSGGTLTQSDVTFTLDYEDGAMVGTVDEVRLIEQGDGTVLITMAPEIPMRVKQRSPDGEEVEISMTFGLQGMELVASGDPGSIDHAMSAERAGVETDAMIVNGQEMDFALAAELDNIDGSYRMSEDSPAQLSSRFTADALAFRLSAAPEDGGEGNLSMTATAQDILSTSEGTLMPFGGPASMAALLRQGGTSTGEMSYGTSTFSMNLTDENQAVRVNGQGESGSISGTIDAAGLDYVSAATGLAMDFAIIGQPFPPVAFEIAEASSRIAFPLLASDDPQDIRLATRLTGVAIGEGLWSMIDPAGVLPRDPATVELDATLTGVINEDLADPEAMARLEASGGQPGELRSARLDRLLLSIAGATLTGDGRALFDNATAPPRAAGQIDLQLVGANALIDNLVKIGMIPEDQAMGAQMMLGMFARPGSGPDTLESTIELREDGSVLANGQRIR